MGKYRVESIAYTTPSIINLCLKNVDSQKPFAFQPGQYAAISFYNKWRWSVARCFSIAGSPLEQSSLEFGIRVAGRYTRALTRLKTGDIIDVRGPFGSFVFDPDNKTHIVMCAGGIGITPFMSMIRYATTLNLGNKITLIVSARNKLEIPYFDELQSLVAQNHHLRLIYVVDAGDLDLPDSRSTKVFSGRISKEVLHDAAGGSISQPRFFLCGPPPFMKGVTSTLLAEGVDRSNIISETFSQGQNLKSGDSRNWPSTIYMAGAFGTVISSMIVMANEMVKTVPQTLLPETLSTDQERPTSGRQQDIDKLVSELKQSLSTAEKSPALIAAENEANAAKEKIAAQSTTGSSTKTSATTRTSSSAPAPAAPAAAPAPQPATPSCVTSASGVTTCQ